MSGYRVRFRAPEPSSSPEPSAGSGSGSPAPRDDAPALLPSRDEFIDPSNGHLINLTQTERRPEAFQSECSICLDDFDLSTPEGLAATATVTLCGHFFHRCCIVEWFNNQGIRGSCPIDRHQVYGPPPENHAGEHLGDAEDLPDADVDDPDARAGAGRGRALLNPRRGPQGPNIVLRPCAEAPMAARLFKRFRPRDPSVEMDGDNMVMREAVEVGVGDVVLPSRELSADRVDLGYSGDVDRDSAPSRTGNVSSSRGRPSASFPAPANSTPPPASPPLAPRPPPPPPMSGTAATTKTLTSAPPLCRSSSDPDAHHAAELLRVSAGLRCVVGLCAAGDADGAGCGSD